MYERTDVVVTGVGFCTALGPEPHAAIAQGNSAVREHDELHRLPHRRAAPIDAVDLRPWLKRRKDRKLMARPAQLALAAAGIAVQNWSGERDTLGLYLGVGREPGDDGESEPALVAAQVDGSLDEHAVAGRCRDLYPPLLPLKTLPNMALAHISIHLDIRGENGAWSGSAASGLIALRAAMWSVRESRCDAALVVAADSWVSVGGVRDLLRMAGGKPILSPGEAGVALLIESGACAQQRDARVLATLDTQQLGAPPIALLAHAPALGQCHAADALLAVALAVREPNTAGWVEASEPDQPFIGVRIDTSDYVAWYAPKIQGDSDV